MLAREPSTDTCVQPRVEVAVLRNSVQNWGMVERETLGARVRRERVAREMTQRALATAVGVGVPHISKLEADRESPSDELLSRIAVELDIDPDELFLVAKRLPPAIVEDLATDPAEAVAFLRTWSSPTQDKT